MTTTTQPISQPRLAGFWHANAYLASDLIIGTVAFSILVAFLATSIGLAVTVLLAIPFAWATILLARWFARVERWRLWAHFGLDVPEPHRPAEGGWIGRLKLLLRDRATWREIGHGLLHLPLAGATFAVWTAIWVIPLTLVTTPLWLAIAPSGRFDLFVTDLRQGVASAVAAVAGLLLLVLVPPTVRALARLRIRPTVALLSPGAEDHLRSRVATLETSRSRAMDAAEAERRRIERDLHDGAQQRLVSLAMDLGMARDKLADEPDQARALIDEAHDEAKRAIVELRNLARGIHPAVLTDRGLAAALSGVAGRSPVPVELDVDVPERLTPTIEGIAYFVVNEALANVAKHAGATRVWVSVRRAGPKLLIEVRDNGSGGADPANGTGLAGLADRVAAVDGWLHVASPDGGPTTLTAELPCAS